MISTDVSEQETFYRAIAPSYDLLFENLHEGKDVEFYCGLAAASAGPVLEMGCGTGRIVLPLARAGVTVYGMDRSLAMLEELCTKLRSEDAPVRGRVTLVHGDIRYDDAGCQFPLIIAAGNVLHSFVDRQDQRAWLRNVRRHLADGGAFCFDVFQFDYRRLNTPGDTWTLEVDRTDVRSGQKISCYCRCEQEPELQRFRVDFRWLIGNASGCPGLEQTASVMQRWFTCGELENLLELEGFRIQDYWGGFGREPFGPGSREQIISAVAQSSRYQQAAT